MRAASSALESHQYHPVMLWCTLLASYHDDPGFACAWSVLLYHLASLGKV